MAGLAGQTLWGMRVAPPKSQRDDNWAEIKLGSLIGSGSFADVYTVAGATRVPILAKIFKGDYAEQAKTDKNILKALVGFSSNGKNLATTLPFVSWPDRILFTTRGNTLAQLQPAVRGYTMPHFADAKPYEHYRSGKGAAFQLTKGDYIHLCITLAHQLDRLHKHDFRFVFSDLSSKNILISNDQRKIYFIDADSYGFRAFGQEKYSFRATMVTPAYPTPYLQGALDERHHNFVLAMIIWEMAMAMHGMPKAKTFAVANTAMQDFIASRQYPYKDPAHPEVPPAILEVYRTLPSFIRAGFDKAFTGHNGLTASEWVDLLNRWRLL